MHGRGLRFALSAVLTVTLCYGPSAHAQSGKARQLREMRASGLSGREVQTRTEIASEQRGEAEAAEESTQTGQAEFDVRVLNKGRRTPVVNALDPETLTLVIIMGMIVLILTKGQM